MILIAFQLSVLMAGSLVDLQTLGSLSIEGEDKSIVDVREVNVDGLSSRVVLTVAKVVKAKVGKVEGGGGGFGVLIILPIWLFPGGSCEMQCDVR